MVKSADYLLDDIFSYFSNHDNYSLMIKVLPKVMSSDGHLENYMNFFISQPQRVYQRLTFEQFITRKDLDSFSNNRLSIRKIQIENHVWTNDLDNNAS